MAELRPLRSERNRAGMTRYGINVENAFGVSVYELRKIARAVARGGDRQRGPGRVDAAGAG